jgi:two-component system nitrate/nitrite response regulator NarL
MGTRSRARRNSCLAGLGLVRLRQPRSAAPVLLLAANDGSLIIIDGLQRGTRSFIPKSSSPDVMMAALQVILAGGTYVPASGLAHQRVPKDSRALTTRQREVLALLAQNRSNKEIADELGMSVNTVRVHVAAILKLLDAENRNEAARATLSLGLLGNSG